MAVPRKAISQKKSTRHCSGLIFEGPARSCLSSFRLKTMKVIPYAISCHRSKGATRMAGGCTKKVLAEFVVPTKSKLSQTLKDQFASPEPYRYHLEGNGHPWRKPRPSSSGAKGYGRRRPQWPARPPQCCGGRATENGSVRGEASLEFNSSFISACYGGWSQISHFLGASPH